MGSRRRARPKRTWRGCAKRLPST